VDSHLESVPGLRTFTTRSLSGGNLEGLGWETDWAFDTKILGLGALDELLADLFEGGDLSGGEGDADLMGFLRTVISSRHPVILDGAKCVLGPLRILPFLACCMTCW
jgi:hypothetical protein